MDFNNLNSRIIRLYKSLGKHYDKDIRSSMRIDREITGDIHSISISFGAQDEFDLTNVVMETIGGIADLKDHLKNKLKGKNQPIQLVEDLINNSLELALITDLNNQEKHGYPLRQKSRTKLNPRILNLSQGLGVKGGETGSVQFTITSESAKYKSASDNMVLLITGQVVDDKDNFIITLDEMIVKAIIDIENFTKVHDLLI